MQHGQRLVRRARLRLRLRRGERERVDGMLSETQHIGPTDAHGVEIVQVRVHDDLQYAYDDTVTERGRDAHVRQVLEERDVRLVFRAPVDDLEGAVGESKEGETRVWIDAADFVEIRVKVGNVAKGQFGPIRVRHRRG